MASPENVELQAPKHDISSILSSADRDYLLLNNGYQVKVDSITGKTVGLYFSASWCGPCQRITPRLVEAYNELLQLNKFEIVFVTRDKDKEAFDAYFSKMPWLAIPFSDSETRNQLEKLFNIPGIPTLVIMDETGTVLLTDGEKVVEKYKAKAFPFTSEHMQKVKEQYEEAKKNQTLKSLLVSQSRDYVITKVPIAELEGKTVALYFHKSSSRHCLAFNPELIEVYKSLKEKRENFEVVILPLDGPSSFEEEFNRMPFLSLPVNDKCWGLVDYFELKSLPALVIIGPDGKTLHLNAADAIEEHGDKAFPFTPEKFAELEETEKAKRIAQTLESILVLNDCDFVIQKDGRKIPVSGLVGKNILLYFSARRYSSCRNFQPLLIKAYREIKEQGNPLEVIFISSDEDQESFNDFFSTMPWLALPFDEKRERSLQRYFKVREYDIPRVIAIGTNGKTVSTDARELIACYGAEAFPFTADRVKQIEAEPEKLAESWPKKVTRELHEHELVLTKCKDFGCNGCGEGGRVWSYYCDACKYDLHPKCALNDDNKGRVEGNETVGEDEAA